MKKKNDDGIGSMLACSLTSSNEFKTNNGSSSSSDVHPQLTLTALLPSSVFSSLFFLLIAVMSGLPGGRAHRLDEGCREKRRSEAWNGRDDREAERVLAGGGKMAPSATARCPRATRAARKQSRD